MVNVGQLVRERYGEDDVVLVGFGSHRGSVIAGEEWDAPMGGDARCRRAAPGSWEDVLHRAVDGEDRLLIFPDKPSDALAEWRGHRAIGVVYRPQYEQYGNYVPTVLPRRYDGFLFVDRTKAVRPLFAAGTELEADEEAETFPTRGLKRDQVDCLL